MEGSHIVIREANRLRIYSEKGQAHDMFSRIFQILIYHYFPTNDYEKFGYSEKATKFEKIFHLKFDATQ